MDPGICNWQFRQQDVAWLEGGAQGQSHDPEVIGSFALDDTFSDFSTRHLARHGPGLDRRSVRPTTGSCSCPPTCRMSSGGASSEEFDESIRPLLVVRYLE